MTWRLLRPMRDFDLNLLRVFDALMRLRSVSVAARELNLTQSSVSNALARLRESLDDRLLERQGNAMVPTRLAQDIWPDVAAALAQISTGLALRQHFDPASARGTFRVAMGDYALCLLGADFAASVVAEAPGVTLELVDAVPDSSESDLAIGRMDLVVDAVWQSQGRLDSRPILIEHFVGLIAPAHPLAQQSCLSPEAFARLPHILTSSRGRVPGSIDVGLDRLGLERHVLVTVPRFEEAARLCAAGVGVLSCGTSLARRLAQNHGLQIFELPLAAPKFTISALYRPENRAAPSLIWLLQKLQSVSEGLVNDPDRHGGV